MNLIIQALQDLWGQIEDVIGTEVLNTILAVTLILFVYFLFIRLFLLICKASKNVKLICDIVVVVICLMVVLNNLLPTFKVEKEVTGVGDGSGGSSVIVNPEISGTAEVLNGLEVDGVQYELPVTHLFLHLVHLQIGGGEFADIHISLLLDSGEVLTSCSNLIYNVVSVSGTVGRGADIVIDFYPYDSNTLYLYYYPYHETAYPISSFTFVSDTVTQVF